jgi:cation:H+ antiporter
MTHLMFLGGLISLVAGAELLVRGASRIASSLGISPLVVGLTVVAFGTSSPELAVSAGAAWSGQGDIAVGNAVGSNIFNVLFILGLSALIAPLAVAQQLVRLDVPLMIGCSALLLLLAADGSIDWLEGALLFAGIIAYTVFLVWQARRERNPDVVAEYAEAYPVSGQKQWARNISLIVAGLALLVVGAQWLVEAAVTFARYFGVSELVIGLTVVAAGTSLPEVAASVVAAVKGERDIAVGNVVGSNIYNILAVLGAAALAAPGGLSVAPAVLNFDLLVMIAACAACLPIFFTGYRVDRWEGAVFLGYYAAYTAYVILDATGHDALVPLSRAMVAFVLPLTALTLAVLAFRAWREQPGRGSRTS